jgi:hypothetical protein
MRRRECGFRSEFQKAEAEFTVEPLRGPIYWAKSGVMEHVVAGFSLDKNAGVVYKLILGVGSRKW